MSITLAGYNASFDTPDELFEEARHNTNALWALCEAAFTPADISTEAAQ
jgi:hypothetical protein